MPKYRVWLETKAWVKGFVEVEAASVEEARGLGEETSRMGEIEWVFDGLEDSMPEIGEVEEVADA